MLNIGKITIVMLAAGCGLFLAAVEPAKAGEAPESGDSDTIAQSTDSGRKRRRRIRTSFFEEERKLFGFGDFLDSALDGAQNAFGADTVTNLSGETSRNALSNTLVEIQLSPNGIPGEPVLSISDFNDNNIGDFLNTRVVGDGVDLTFSNSQPNSDSRTGRITVQGSVTANGRTFTFNNEVRNWSVIIPDCNKSCET